MDNKSIFDKIAKECNRTLPRPNDVYQHFKGMKVVITGLALHTETEEPLVIYTHEGTLWARPLRMFLEPVDKEKYPNAKQYYRLERIWPSAEV